MSVAVVDPAFRATSIHTGHELLVIAITQDPQLGLGLLCIDEDGSLGSYLLPDINMNWRYDNRKHKWVAADLEEEDDDE